MNTKVFPRLLLCACVVFAGSVLSGCNDEKSSSADQAKSDKAALDQHNAELARRQAVTNQIK